MQACVQTLTVVVFEPMSFGMLMPTGSGSSSLLVVLASLPYCLLYLEHLHICKPMILAMLVLMPIYFGS